MTIKEFIKTKLPKLKKYFGDDGMFAICNYVPPWSHDNEKLVRENFKHCFVFYVGNRDFISPTLMVSQDGDARA